VHVLSLAPGASDGDRVSPRGYRRQRLSRGYPNNARCPATRAA
jgi:hypothetical protein